MKTSACSRRWLLLFLPVFVILLTSIVTPDSARTIAGPGLIAPEAYPPDPLADIDWNAGYEGVLDVQLAFNYARAQESAQLGITLPYMSLPSQSIWDSMSNNQRALWLINQERLDRGVSPLHGVEANVIGVAQNYAEFLLENDLWGHTADGHDPWWRLEANPAIGACHDFLQVAENLAVFVTSGSSIPLPIERAVYAWMYEDQGSLWGHRHAILWYPYNDNSGTPGVEGFLGIGRASGGPYQGPFSNPWPFAELIVMNVFDPCATWDYSVPGADEWVYLPMTLRRGLSGGEALK